MRNVAAIAVAVLAGWVVMKIVFGFAGGLIGLLLGLAWFAFRLALVLGIAYWVLTLVSPETARKIRDRVVGPESV